MFIVLLGAALMTVPEFLSVYTSDDAAGVLKAGRFLKSMQSCLCFSKLHLPVFEPWGKGGDFLLVILALSVIANNSTS